MTIMPASPIIKEAHKKAHSQLPFSDRGDYENAQRGFLAAPKSQIIHDQSGKIVWNNELYNFLSEDEAPDTVHPSLWRQSQLTRISGLFEVVEGIYQVRGLDLSNITFVISDTGVIIIDTLTCVENAKAAWELFTSHFGTLDIKAVIYTHSHADHFGGVKGVITQQEVDEGKVLVVAPEGFLEDAISENVYAGTAMARRAGYMYGAVLPKSPYGQVGTGLGQTVPNGTISLIPPTHTIRSNDQMMNIDGIDIEFQLTPGAEAPSEMNFYFPRYKALCLAENATHTMHNIATLRGAQVRDAKLWSRYINESIEIFAHKTEVAFASHHWPKWGHENITKFLTAQRDIYGYLHDETLRLINKGFTGTEIAENFKLPPALEQEWSTRGYYGSISHNVKAVYQRYLGWFDGNPAHLWQHEPTTAAQKHVKAMGGIDQVIALAQTAYDEGDYRWAATLLDYAVFTDADHTQARELFAQTLTQLGYGSENGTWRNFFLCGAHELRSGNFGTPAATAPVDILSRLSLEHCFDLLAIRLDSEKIWSMFFDFDCVFIDENVCYHLQLSNGVLSFRETDKPHNPTVITMTRPMLLILFTQGLEAAIQAGLTLEGDKESIFAIINAIDPGDPSFNIITP